jgi:hypothetical protein
MGIVSFPNVFVPDAIGAVMGHVEGLEAIRHTSLTMRTLRAAITSVTEVRRGLGDDHLHDVSGLDLFGPADAGDLPDDLHPNDAGNERIAERFATITFGAGARWPLRVVGSLGGRVPCLPYS